MKKKLIRAIALLCLVSMLTACGSEADVTAQTEAATEVKTQSAESKVQTSETTEAPAEVKGVTFPLADPVTFRIGVKGTKIDEEFTANCSLLKRLEKETNVKIEWVNLGDEALTTLNGMLASGSKDDKLDAVIGVVSDSSLCDLAYGGFVAPLEGYLKDKDLMPNYQVALEGCADAIRTMTIPDGHIYSVARFDQNPSSYLESPLVINKKWLAEAGLEEINSLNDFHDYLVFIRDHDMNGDGNPNDEIPLLMTTSSADAYATVQAALSMWGIATKDAALDSYTTIRDGKVFLAPTTEAYKEAMKTLGEWYKENLIWSECYTANAESYKAKLNNEVPQWGAVFTGYTVENSLPYFSDLAMMPIPAADGYKAKAYVNSGINGYKNTFTVFNTCENKDILMGWLDHWYTEETYVEIYYGSQQDAEDYGRILNYEIDGNGIYTFRTLTADEKKINEESGSKLWTNSGSGAYLWLRSEYMYNVSHSMSNKGFMKMREEIYPVYKDMGILNTEIWPRPYYTVEVSDEIAALRTDIYAIINQYEASWVTGQSDIEADWDAFNTALQAAGSERLVEILQNSYDSFLGTK